MTTAGEAVRAVREAANMTQVEFSKELGFPDHSRVGQVERGHGTFRSKTIALLCTRFRREMAICDVTPLDFLRVGSGETGG